MTRKPEICKECEFFSHEETNEGKHYVFCLKDDWMIKWYAELNPEKFSEELFFTYKISEKNLKRLCPFYTEYCVNDWNEKED